MVKYLFYNSVGGDTHSYMAQRALHLVISSPVLMKKCPQNFSNSSSTLRWFTQGSGPQAVGEVKQHIWISSSKVFIKPLALKAFHPLELMFTQKGGEGVGRTLSRDL